MMVLFNQEIRVILFAVIICMTYSCKMINLVKRDIDTYIACNESDIESIRKFVKYHFQELVENENENVLQLISCRSWEVDPVVYVKEDKKRFYTHLNTRQFERRDAQIDVSTDLIGAFINGKWHFLKGSVTYYPRDDYKSDGNTPFTFEELSYLANRNLFPSIVSQKGGKYIVSNEFFSNALKELDSSNQEGDSLFLARANAYSTKSVPKEKLDRIRQEQKASRPRVIEPPSLWQRWFGKKKLFDNKEWKNRRKELVVSD